MSNEYRSSHFALTHRIIARISRRLDGVIYRQRRGLIRGMKRRGGLGFVPELLTRDDNAELRFLRQLDLAGQVVYDVGAFEGLMTLFFSRQARHVVTYEPNQASHSRVQEHLRLNGIRNVTLRNVALSETPGVGVLTIDLLMPGAASLDPGISQLIRTADDVVSEEIQMVRLDDDIADRDLPDPDFLEMDIEGCEIPALRGMRETLARARPRIFVEIHGTTREDKRQRVHEIVEFLAGVGYRNILHVESTTTIGPDNCEVAAQGHLFCQPGTRRQP